MLKVGLLVPLAAPLATPDFVATLGRERATTPHDLAAFAKAGADQVILTTFARDAASLRARLASLAETLPLAAQRL